MNLVTKIALSTLCLAAIAADAGSRTPRAEAEWRYACPTLSAQSWTSIGGAWEAAERQCGGSFEVLKFRRDGSMTKRQVR